MSASIAPRIYLDHNATTPVFPEVIEAMRSCWSEPYLNPASQHEFGRRARRALEDARERIGELLGASTSGVTRDRVVFTSGGTESNNLAICGLLGNNANRGGAPETSAGFVLSSIEHPSISNLAKQLSHRGYRVGHLEVGPEGIIRTDDLDSALQPETRVVAAMLANNETGVLQPVAKLAAICNERGIPLHTDAAQVAGKLAVSFQDLGAATMTIAAHKFGGPVGIGALFVRRDIQLLPLLQGGVQQSGMRPGTESVALAVGMRVALELWDQHRREWFNHLEKIRNEFERALKLACAPVEILGDAADRLPNTSNVAFLGLDRQALFVALDQAGIACSTGSACASGSSEPSPVHIAMGCERAVVSSALRFSFGIQTTGAGIAESTERILRICNDLRSRKQS